MTYAENRQNRNLIIDRLKSGRDEKEIGLLKNTRTGCLCFQGVIADEYIRQTGNAAWAGEHDDAAQFRYAGLSKTAWLPSDVIAWSGFSDHEIAQYTALNDDEDAKLTLEQIGRIADTLGERD